MTQSRLHKAIEIAEAGTQRQAFENAAKIPLYRISDSLFRLVTDIGPALPAMISEAVRRDTMRLPFLRVLIEYEFHTGEIVWVWAEEPEWEGEPERANFATWFYVMHKGVAACVGGRTDVVFSENGRVATYRHENGHDTDKLALATVRRLTVSLLTRFLLAFHIRGVENEHMPAPKNLNKARIAKGKPPIREFTVLRVGHVYDRDGKAHAVGTGRKMPIHMRAGHSRRQHYGKANALVKTIYVPPTIVNFDPNSEVKMPKRILKV